MSSSSVRSRGWISVWAEAQPFRQAISVLVGVMLLALLAQVSLRLPFTPVPITGQTFGVYLIALIYGRKLGSITVASYLFVGALGAPIFASAQSGLSFGPTLGYLVGMMLASLVVGELSDGGFARGLKGAWGVAIVGSVCVFSCGLIGLSFFVPKAALLASGLFPFIPGDLIKTALAASIASSFRPSLKK